MRVEHWCQGELKRVYLVFSQPKILYPFLRHLFKRPLYEVSTFSVDGYMDTLFGPSTGGYTIYLLPSNLVTSRIIYTGMSNSPVQMSSRPPSLDTEWRLIVVSFSTSRRPGGSGRSFFYLHRRTPGLPRNEVPPQYEPGQVLLPRGPSHILPKGQDLLDSLLNPWRSPLLRNNSFD